jgi:hypothetical protein
MRACMGSFQFILITINLWSLRCRVFLIHSHTLFSGAFFNRSWILLFAQADEASMSAKGNLAQSAVQNIIDLRIDEHGSLRQLAIDPC